jgi:ParB family chromosome partitioning protein|nr:MAG TPA: chromosome partitioning protein [Caudoviricetes sp.]
MAFDIKDFLNPESKKEMTDDFVLKKIPAEKLHPSDKNFYEMDPVEIEALKETIELVGVQENLVVKKISAGENAGDYEIIAGHKRHRAVTELLAEGKEVSPLLPCKVESDADGVKNELILIFTNSTQRERSDYCKMQEIQRVRELLEEYAKYNNMPGRKRDVIAGILNTSKSTIGRLDNIRRNIIPDFLEEYKAGKISTTAANEIAGATPEEQHKLLEKYKETGSIHAKEAAQFKTPVQQLPEQANINDYPGIAPEEPQEVKTPEEKANENKDYARNEEIAEKPAEPQTEVTITRQQDTTDRKSLIISGRINPNKEYNGMNVKYFADAITNSDLFDNDFWSGWVSPDISKPNLIREYQGILTAFTASTGEPCQVEITDKVTVKRTEAAAVGEICFKEFAEIVDALILTKVVTVQREEIDIPYWIKETAREIAGLAIWATENELSVLQDIALKMKERAGK